MKIHEVRVTIGLDANLRTAQVVIDTPIQVTTQHHPVDNLLTRISVEVQNAVRVACEQLEKERLAYAKSAAAAAAANR